jgi:hypothetical protein
MWARAVIMVGVSQREFSSATAWGSAPNRPTAIASELMRTATLNFDILIPPMFIGPEGRQQSSSPLAGGQPDPLIVMQYNNSQHCRKFVTRQ